MTAKDWTIAAIAQELMSAGNHYFDRETLRFFGQRRSDFRVYTGGDRIFMFASASRGWDSPGLSSFAEFVPPKDGKPADTESVRYGDDISHSWTRLEVKELVKDLRQEFKAAGRVPSRVL
jgi:hypothetical protein